MFALIAFAALAAPRSAPAAEIRTPALLLRAQQTAAGLMLHLSDRATGFVYADGPWTHSATRVGLARAEGLLHAALSVSNGEISMTGTLAGLQLKQTLKAGPGGAWIDERIVISNPTHRRIALSALEIGLTRRIADDDGVPLADVSRDRWAAVPLRRRADDDPARGINDHSALDLLTKAGWEPAPSGWGRVSRPWRISEGWAWTHGGASLGVFRFCRERLTWSALEARAGRLRFGGVRMLGEEPADLGRMAPGARVDLGFTRYQRTAGGWQRTALAFRAMLDSQGCGTPARYNAPIHWEQLYDMEGAWDNRPQRYTRAALEAEALKAVAYSCEALYLDPGWDTAMGTFLWGRWLGPFRQFTREMRARHGLGVALHTPLATWMSSPGMSMGPFGAPEWPKTAGRRAPGSAAGSLRVPAERGGRLNLALAPTAKVAASSLFDGGKWPIHQTPHLIDGWYGNGASWIAGEMPAWAEVDLGAVQRIGAVWLGNDHAGQFTDRIATRLRVLTAESAERHWQEALPSRSVRLMGTTEFRFAPVAARFVRIEIEASADGQPRLDEIEVIAAAPSTPAEVRRFAASVHRGAAPAAVASGPLICLASKQYLDEAARRLLSLCADGAAFLMYDGNWWSGGCIDPRHGHAVPCARADHIAANIELARRVHARYPGVYIEMHDMLAGGNPARPTPVYLGYGLPGSYDDNWGFELMWDPMADLRAGRGLALYDYNVGCGIPVYLHIDLRKDNRECVVLWWYASTCRHLGVGGTHRDPAVAAAQRQAMGVYRRLERFYKRGVFHGMTEAVHVHALPAENAAVANVFNVSDREQTIEQSARLADLGLRPGAGWSAPSEPWCSVLDGRLTVRITLPPWSARVATVGVR